MRILGYIFDKMSDLENYLNNVPVENRKGMAIKICLVLFLLLIFFTFIGRCSLSKEEKTDVQKDVDEAKKELMRLSDEVDAELSKGTGASREKASEAFRLIDSLNKAESAKTDSSQKR